MTARRHLAPFAFAVALTAAAIAGPYDPPPDYYDSATGVGAALKSNLHQIISPHLIRSYGDARQGLAVTDRDPANPSNIILTYNGASVPGVWDQGNTWNREHTWPRSLGVGDSGPDYSDLHALRPCDPGVNGLRGNKPFGTELFNIWWDPDRYGAPFRGEMARAMFYMDVRYDGGEGSTVDLVLVEGLPSGNAMGDLAQLLEWHYLQPPDEDDRRRNHLIYSSTDNPAHYQGNRNPFIDHPEYVWAIWGPTPNDSTLYVDASPGPDGGSSTTADLGLFIAGSAPSPQSVMLHKNGATPTTYDVTATGDAASSPADPFNAFVSGAQTGEVVVSIVGGATPGALVGQVIVDNTDLTSAGPGAGAQDADDIITVTAAALHPSNASFVEGGDLNSLTLDFGQLESDGGVAQMQFILHNIEEVAPWTAALDLDSIDEAGDTAVLFTDLAPFDDLAPDDSTTFTAYFDTNAGPGVYEATFTLHVSDQDIPGAAPGAPLLLTLTGEAVAEACPADINGDGEVNGIDLALVLGAWGDAAQDEPADLDDNGAVDGVDLAFVLGAWGPCA